MPHAPTRRQRVGSSAGSPGIDSYGWQFFCYFPIWLYSCRGIALFGNSSRDREIEFAVLRGVAFIARPAQLHRGLQTALTSVYTPTRRPPMPRDGTEGDTQDDSEQFTVVGRGGRPIKALAPAAGADKATSSGGGERRVDNAAEAHAPAGDAPAAVSPCLASAIVSVRRRTLIAILAIRRLTGGLHEGCIYMRPHESIHMLLHRTAGSSHGGVIDCTRTDGYPPRGVA